MFFTENFACTIKAHTDSLKPNAALSKRDHNPRFNQIAKAKKFAGVMSVILGLPK